MMHAAGLDLSSSQVERLVARTEGWAAGLRLAAMSAARAPDPERFLPSSPGTTARSATTSRRRCSRCSPPRSASSCCARASSTASVAGSADAPPAGRTRAETLERLEHEGALIVGLDRRGRWYRYHGLFSELLGPGSIRRIRAFVPTCALRAGTWLAANGLGARGGTPHRLRGPDGRPRRPARDHWVELVLGGACARHGRARLPPSRRRLRLRVAAAADVPWRRAKYARRSRCSKRLTTPRRRARARGALGARARGDADSARAARRPRRCARRHREPRDRVGPLGGTELRCRRLLAAARPSKPVPRWSARCAARRCWSPRASGGARGRGRHARRAARAARARSPWRGNRWSAGRRMGVRHAGSGALAA